MNRPSEPQQVTCRFRWALPAGRAPVEDAWALIENGALAQLQSYAGQSVDRTFENAVLVPAASNAHCHLELSDFRALRPLDRPVFTTWLAGVIRFRQEQRAKYTSSSPPDLAASWRRGAETLPRYHTDWIGDIVSPEVLRAIAPLEACRGTLFTEWLGWTRSRVAETQGLLRRFLAQPPALNAGWSWGLSPHATYTVAPQLLAELCQAARSENLPVAMHVAESGEEMELLINQTGPLVELLRSVGAWEPGVIVGRFPPLEYLRILETAPRALVIHGTYLEPPEWDFLASHRDRMAVVYCPRTHAAFDHRPYPLAGMLRAGVRVLLGTDSLATAPDLNIWREVAACVRLHPNVSPQRALAMVTADTWQWRGVPLHVGSPASPARTWVAFALEQSSDPYSFLYTDAPRAVWSSANAMAD